MKVGFHPARAKLAARLHALGARSGTAFDGELFRFINPRYSSATQVIDGVGSLHASGRWNLKGAARLSHTSLAPHTALSEALAHVNYHQLPVNQALPRVLVALRLRAQRVLDLRAGMVRARLKLSERTIVGLDWRAENQNGREAVTQAWGLAFAQAGFEAVVAPSATDSNGTNVVVFPENLQTGSRFDVVTEVKWSAR